jgi:3-deoxy-D-manno-octulosonic-acid transferase
METELWPNLIAAAAARNVPLALANARLSERSARGYARLPALTRSSLQALAAVAAQTDADARRLCDLGAPEVKVCGNLKFDITPPAALIERGHAWRAQWGDRPVWLAASTRDGEEALLLDEIHALAPGVLVVIVPRHPQRFDAVARAVAARGIACTRRSELGDAPLAATIRVLLGDSLGELFGYYTAADVAFVGGSLLPFGGQNLIEAASVGCPVLVGAHTWNFADATRDAIDAGAALRADDAATLVRQVSDLIDDAPRRLVMGECGRAFTARHRGAAGRIADGLARQIAAR